MKLHKKKKKKRLRRDEKVHCIGTVCLQGEVGMGIADVRRSKWHRTEETERERASRERERKVFDCNYVLHQGEPEVRQKWPHQQNPGSCSLVTVRPPTLCCPPAPRQPRAAVHCGERTSPPTVASVLNFNQQQEGRQDSSVNQFPWKMSSLTSPRPS